MNDKRPISFPAVGGSSLLVIFSVLCLTVFALLTLATVQAGARLSDQSARAVEDYYLADTQAESVLAALRRGELPPQVRREGDGLYAYDCPISDTQTLSVLIRLEAGGGYEILRWQAVSTARWEADDDLPVWDGG